MNTYTTRKQINLTHAVGVGVQLKSKVGFGKEYYVISLVAPDTLLDWVEYKIGNLLGINTYTVSVTGVVFDMIEAGIFAKTSYHDYCVIHKKRFKRFIKKAVQRNIKQ